MAKTNEIKRQKFNAWIVLLRQFKNPLLLVFIISTIVAFLVGERNEAFAIWIVMTLSITLGFWNEYQAGRVVQDLIRRISFTVNVLRNGEKINIPVAQVRVGDEITLHPGAIIPADMKIKVSEGLEVNESILTGESLPIYKKDGDVVFMGTVVTGGNAHGIVTMIGMDTKFGKISELASHARPQTEFQKGLTDFSFLLARIAGITVIVVIAFGFFLHHPIVETILFALTVAMGIAPELLPLIVTISLSYGAKRMAKKEVIVKQLVSIEDLGNMEVLCTDKTGTLTEGKISLSSYQNALGKEDHNILHLGIICNSGFTHGHSAADSIDRAILDYAKFKGIEIIKRPKTLFEIPFNFENRFMAIGVKDGDGDLLICKGSPEAIISRTKHSDSEKKRLEKMAVEIQKQGLRAIAVASKKIQTENPKLIKNDFRELNFDGFISFADVPKKNLSEDFKKYVDLGVVIKVITGDSEVVAEKVAKEVGFSFKRVLLNYDVERMNDDELAKAVWETDIFARITPSQKVRIIQALKRGNHTIGYMGDGINDGPALHVADVGISVNTGVDVAKDAASIVLLHKDLGVLADGIEDGRITFQNTIKYILMGSSSDFGNMISAAIGSVILPFLPMTPIQFLLNDILYDISQTSIPSDNVDSDQILRPRSWDIHYIKRFMVLFGLIGTLYDLLTFAVMYFAFHARDGYFQTGWFVTSFITQVLVVFVIRTGKIPFWKSKPSLPFAATCLSVVLVALILPYSPLAIYFDFMRLPELYFVYLIILSMTYLIVVELGKYYMNQKTYEISHSKS